MDSVCRSCKKLHRSQESNSADYCKRCLPLNCELEYRPEDLRVELETEKDKVIESQKRVIGILSEENDLLKDDIDRLTEMLAKEDNRNSKLAAENTRLIELMEQRKTLDSLGDTMQQLHERVNNIATTPPIMPAEAVAKVIELEKRCAAVVDPLEKPKLERQINELHAACEPPEECKTAIDALMEKIALKHKQGLLAEKPLEELKSLIDSVPGGGFYVAEYEKLAAKNGQIKKKRPKSSTKPSK